MLPLPDRASKSSLIDSDRYLLTCMRYIELNRIRANLMEHSGEYIWSSCHAKAQGKADELIECLPIYNRLGSTPEIRHVSYRELLNQYIDNDTCYYILLVNIMYAKKYFNKLLILQC